MISRLLALTITAALALGVAGCGGSDKASTGTDNRFSEEIRQAYISTCSQEASSIDGAKRLCEVQFACLTRELTFEQFLALDEASGGRGTSTSGELFEVAYECAREAAEETRQERGD